MYTVEQMLKDNRGFSDYYQCNCVCDSDFFTKCNLIDLLCVFVLEPGHNRKLVCSSTITIKILTQKKCFCMEDLTKGPFSQMLVLYFILRCIGVLF